MKVLRVFVPLTLFVLWLCSTASAQTPNISGYSVSGCTYTSGNPCAIGPGTVLTVTGSNFGSSPLVFTCDCGYFIPSSRSGSSITVVVYSVTANSSIQVETEGGAYSNTVPYTAIPAQITKLVVGSCTYIPNQSSQQCVITAGTQFTLYGNYFGPGPLTSGPQISMCDCNGPTINSWDTGWTDSSTGADATISGTITATAQVAECGNSIVVWAEDFNTLGSNPVPYTTCQ
jgi:hypothetical protein